MVSVVLFDLGDVIARYDPAPRIARYAERSGRSNEEVRELLHGSGFSEDCDRGVYPSKRMQAEICRRLGCLFSRDELLDLQALAFTIRPSMLALAGEVARRARTGLLTNNSPLLEEACPGRFPELCRAFHPMLFSHRLGDLKPSVALFEKIAGLVGAPPSEILLVDDQTRHVEGARRAGWQALRFDGEPALRTALAERGVLEAH